MAHGGTLHVHTRALEDEPARFINMSARRFNEHDIFHCHTALDKVVMSIVFGRYRPVMMIFPIAGKPLKVRFVRTPPRNERLSAVRVAKGDRGIWHRRFWEHLACYNLCLVTR